MALDRLGLACSRVEGRPSWYGRGWVALHGEPLALWSVVRRRVRFAVGRRWYRLGRKEEGPSRLWKLDIRKKGHCDEKSSGGEERARNKGHCRKGRAQIAYKGGNERTHLLFGFSAQRRSDSTFAGTKEANGVLGQNDDSCSLLKPRLHRTYDLTLRVLVIGFHPVNLFLSERNSAYNKRYLVGYRSALARVIHEILDITGSQQNPLTGFAQYRTSISEFVDLS